MRTPQKKKAAVPKWVPMAAVIAVCILLAAVCILLSGTAAGEKTVFTVNGVGITPRHEQLYLDDVRAQVTAYYHAKFGADPNEEGFWQADFDGRTPAEYQRELAWRRLIRDTVERQLARENGLDVPLTLEEIDQAREARNQTAGIRYGPEEYGVMEYIAQTQTQVRDSLKTALLAGDLAPTEADLYTLYQQADRVLLDKGYSATVGVIACGTMQVGVYPEALPQALELVKTLWSGPERAAEVIAQVEERTGVTLEYSSVSFDTVSLQKEDDLLPKLAEGCRAVPAGGFSEPWESGVARGIAVVLEKDDRGMATFEEAQRALTNLWINENYDGYIERAVNAAEIR